jgi:hypothetical protein
MIAMHAIVRSLLVVTVSVTIAEFIELQKLSNDDLRIRFQLSSSCEPAVTALATDPAVDRVMVAIECRTKSTPITPPARSPGDRSRG